MQTQTNVLRDMLENIAQELAPQYEGRIVVRRHKPNNNFYIPGDHTFLYVTEEKPEKRFLGIFPRTERRILFVVNEDYSEVYGKKNMYTCLADDKAEAIVKKHLDQYVEEHSDYIEVHIRRSRILDADPNLLFTYF